MNDEEFHVGDIVCEIGYPTKFVLCAFDEAGAVLDIVMDSSACGRPVLRSGIWIGNNDLRKGFVVTGKWDFVRDMEYE